KAHSSPPRAVRRDGRLGRFFNEHWGDAGHESGAHSRREPTSRHHFCDDLNRARRAGCWTWRLDLGLFDVRCELHLSVTDLTTDRPDLPPARAYADCAWLDRDHLLGRYLVPEDH